MTVLCWVLRCLYLWFSDNLITWLFVCFVLFSCLFSLGWVKWLGPLSLQMSSYLLKKKKVAIISSSILLPSEKLFTYMLDCIILKYKIYALFLQFFFLHISFWIICTALFSSSLIFPQCLISSWSHSVYFFYYWYCIFHHWKFNWVLFIFSISLFIMIMLSSTTWTFMTACVLMLSSTILNHFLSFSLSFFLNGCTCGIWHSQARDWIQTATAQDQIL